MKASLRKPLLFAIGATIALIVILVLLRMANKKESMWGSYIVFKTANETRKLLREDADGYVMGMSMEDIAARRATSKKEYISRSMAAVRDFTKDQQDLLSRLCTDADHLLSIAAKSNDIAKGALEMPWVLALTFEGEYEDGLPHTRGDTIMLSTRIMRSGDKEFVRTLIHEKVHIYQKSNPEVMEAWLNKEGYRKIQTRSSVVRIRANPDVDGWVYADPVSGAPMVATYASSQPSSITDIIATDLSFEHPFERMAYELAESISQM